MACREEHAGALGFARFLTDGKKSPAISLPCLCFAARLGKGMKGGAREEREGDDRWSQPGGERERPDRRGRGGFTVRKPRSNGREG